MPLHRFATIVAMGVMFTGGPAPSGAAASGPVERFDPAAPAARSTLTYRVTMRGTEPFTTTVTLNADGTSTGTTRS